MLWNIVEDVVTHCAGASYAFRVTRTENRKQRGARRMIGFIVTAALSLLLGYYLLSRLRLCNARYPPIQEVLAQSTTRYDLRDLNVPTATGLLFKLLIRLQFSRLGQWTVVPYFVRRNALRMQGIHLPEKPTLYPTPCYPPPISGDYSVLNRAVLEKLVKNTDELATGSEFRFPTVADYHRAYESGQCTPTDVAKAALEAIELSNSLSPPLRAITDTKRSVVLAMAEASTDRWQNGKTLSLLDGVPVSVKGLFRVEPYECLSGCAKSPEIVHGMREASTVRKLKEAGAVIVGIANLQEFGAGTLGSNPNHRHITPRNPYNTKYYCGGSSSGSAASVAAGLCPVSIGTDGGGSIRTPGAVCGVVGLKQTFGLVDQDGSCPSSYSVSVSGPLCSSVVDAAVTTDIMARETEGERVLASLEGINSTEDLSGVRIGVYWEYFNHADGEIVERCKEALFFLESLGAEVVEVAIPELEESRVAHFVSIISEMSHSLSLDADKNFSVLNLESLFVIGAGYPLTASHYISAQKQRTRALACLGHLFQKVDVLVTPSTACIITPVSEGAVRLGELDGTTSGRLMRYAFLANLCGNPALTLPVGYTEEAGLPIGLMLTGRHYEERVLLRLGLALERSGRFPTKKPQVFYNLLKS